MFEQKLKRVLVPVEGVPSDEDSVRLACAQAKRDKSDIVLLYVIEVKRNLPIDAEIGEEQGKGERVLDELEHFAHQQGIRVQTDLVQAREAGPAIVGAASERGTDLIIMGVPYREKFGNFNVESRAIHVLENAPCRVCLVRQPLKSAVAR